MEKQIVKVEPRLKEIITSLIGCKWNDVRIVLFEVEGIRVYHNSYGTETLIKYEQLNKQRI